jgi:hypothetical protein
LNPAQGRLRFWPG